MIRLRLFLNQVKLETFILQYRLKIELTQNGKTAASTSFGFVPLINAHFRYQFTDQLFTTIDMDALAAPQGRAEDIRLSLGYRPLDSNWEIDLGYRTLEGGADRRKTAPVRVQVVTSRLFELNLVGTYTGPVVMFFT